MATTIGREASPVGGLELDYGAPRSPRGRKGGDDAPATRMLPGLIVVGLPVVLGAWSLLALALADAPLVVEEGSWEPVIDAFTAATDPTIPLLLSFFLPLALPPVLAGFGFGSIARWLSLAAFCFAGTVVFSMVAVLFVVGAMHAEDAATIGYRSGQVLARLCPFFGLESCGCLLAAGFAVHREP